MMYKLAHHFRHRREWKMDRVPILLPFRGYVLSGVRNSPSEHTIHTCVVAIDNCKQGCFPFLEVLVCVKESHQSVCRAILRSDNAGCRHLSALSSTTINFTSRRSGIEVLRYDFADPQSGKDLCNRKIAPCKQRLWHYVAGNQNVESAKDWHK